MPTKWRSYRDHSLCDVTLPNLLLFLSLFCDDATVMRCLFQHGDLLGLSTFSDFETRRICVGPMLNLNAKDAFDFAVVGYHKRRGNQTGLVLQGVTDTRHCQCNSRHNLFVRLRHHVIASRCLFIYLFINSQKIISHA